MTSTRLRSRLIALLVIALAVFAVAQPAAAAECTDGGEYFRADAECESSSPGGGVSTVDAIDYATKLITSGPGGVGSAPPVGGGSVPQLAADTSMADEF